MNKITLLPEQLINKIAAGEVVQRPESVVKELIENALDANSTMVELIVRGAGKTLIQVIDNGEGMNEEDARMCILKHATSKISTADDLDSILTYGFRGEALSSIAAVSNLEIRTRRNEDELGNVLRYENETTVVMEKASLPVGTSVVVKNLFYNTPGRRKFLKSDPTELKHITDTFNKLALSHPEISFRFYNNDEKVLDYVGGSLQKRTLAVLGEPNDSNLIPVELDTEYINIKGYVSKPSILRKSRGEQYLYLNKRFVIAKQINHAVFAAYENFLEKGDYPLFVLFIDIDPSKIDINVHPSKLEVRFDDERGIYSLLLSTVRRALSQFDLVPNLKFTGTTTPTTEKLTYSGYMGVGQNDFGDRPKSEFRGPASFNTPAKKSYSDSDIEAIFGKMEGEMRGAEKFFGDHNSSTPTTEQLVVNEPVQNELFRVVESTGIIENSYPFTVQLHNKYILSQIRSGLMIIDQHIAHERILYEKALKMFETNNSFTQPLMFKKTIELDPGMYEIFKEMNEYLLRLGFELNLTKKNSVVIESVPADLTPGAEEQLLFEIVDEYKNNYREKAAEIKHGMAASYSCRMALKAGARLSDKEMQVLIDELFSTSNPYVCPHGRPIVIKITLDEFDKRFGRTS